MCTTGEEPGSGRERRREDRPAATGPDEFHIDRDALAPDAGTEPDDDTATSFPRGVEAPMEPLIADFSDGAGAAGEVVAAVAGVVMGAVVPADGVLSASWASSAVGVALFEVAESPARSVFDAPLRVSELAPAALAASALLRGIDAVDAPFKFGRDKVDNAKWFLAAVAAEPSDEEDVSEARRSDAAASALEFAVVVGFVTVVTGGTRLPAAVLEVAGKLRASSAFNDSGAFLGASTAADEAPFCECIKILPNNSGRMSRAIPTHATAPTKIQAISARASDFFLRLRATTALGDRSASRCVFWSSAIGAPVVVARAAAAAIRGAGGLFGGGGITGTGGGGTFCSMGACSLCSAPVATSGAIGSAGFSRVFSKACHLRICSRS